MPKRLLKKYFSQIASIICSLMAIFIIYIYFEKFYVLFHNPLLLKELIISYGGYSLLVFIILQIFQVIIFIIPGEVVQIAGGYIYGAFFGAVISMLGILLGSTCAFFLANKLGKKHVLKLVSKKHIKFLDKIIEYGGNKRIILALHLIPGVPKDILGYICGITNVRFKDFIIFSTLGRIPGIVLSTVFGANLVEKNYLLIGIVSFITVILLLVSVLKGEHFMDRFLNKR